MSIRLFVTLKVRNLILLLVLGAFLAFNIGSTLAAQNRSAAANGQTRNSQLNGQLIANGPVTVNGNKAITGTTIFTDSNIVVDCANGNSAIVNLGTLGRIELVAGTKLTLRFSDGMISGDLQDGKAIINTSPGVKVAVTTPDGVVSSDCAQSCVTPVAVQGFVQCAAVAPAPARVPLPPAGLSGRAIAGILAGAGAAGAVAASTAGSDHGPITPPATTTRP